MTEQLVQGPKDFQELDITTIHQIVREQNREDLSILEVGRPDRTSIPHWFKQWEEAKKKNKNAKAPVITRVSKSTLEEVRGHKLFNGYVSVIEGDFISIPNVVLPKEQKFDIIFIDVKPTREVMAKTLQASKKYCIPYSTILCGVGYHSQEDWVSAIVEFASKERVIFEPVRDTGVWKMRLTNI